MQQDLTYWPRQRRIYVQLYAWERNAYRILVGNPEGKSSLGRPKRKWEDDSK
jgi:hypothetical protein